ncbi:putative RNase H-like HicB family nuclease [Nocardiopsis mwathae]|uniref:Putative RNase H-like HicB family nuclease n=1 Tax=Nocardiopsis mwathae TaxID=1472723 RepID=A0A7X0D7J8_9ACTN|nr:type II toxin-antitoxin system HicB family antitoxin [Nocardiopsis mwathae]MBB6173089.1 putative RNase H-like HicB family nuclease [Nocardiopsis mwathae]
MERTLRLTATITPDSELGGYVARAVEVEVASQGETIEEAVENLREALELYFEDEELPMETPDEPGFVTSVDVRLSA